MKTCILITISLFLGHCALAQMDNIKEPCWKVHTNALTKKTTINFFDTNKHLVYQEVISDKYIKLTHKNRKILDKVLLQVMQNNLVATNAKLSTVESIPLKRVSHRVNTYLDDTWQCNSIIKLNKLQVNVQNPKDEKISVRLYNSKGKAVFISLFTHTQFKLYNLSRLAIGTYQLIVSDGENSYTKNIFISYEPFKATIGKAVADLTTYNHQSNYYK